ncbi:uncharacterized protein LOC6547463 isoform X2 [Drosophila erecta]|uniref:uncharacterized protein LOC6547463 isoform X2 n=1 Tax=Drosophila erecta TaxID=7220 RepID=UPI000F05948A|nr:uncharacterized protein LOC6547463 isoform X2 [Drosophila erecta]
MYCEQPPQKPEKNTCRCKNCVLRHSDILPWPEPVGFMAERKNDKDNINRMSTFQSADSVVTITEANERHTDHNKKHRNNLNDTAYTPNRSGISTPVYDVDPSSIRSSLVPNEGNTPPRKGGNSPSRTTTQPPAQPTILLIVVKTIHHRTAKNVVRNIKANDIQVRDPGDIQVRDTGDIQVRDPGDIQVRDLGDIQVRDLEDIPLRDLEDIPLRDLEGCQVRDLEGCQVRVVDNKAIITHRQDLEMELDPGEDQDLRMSKNLLTMTGADTANLISQVGIDIGKTGGGSQEDTPKMSMSRNITLLANPKPE